LNHLNPKPKNRLCLQNKYATTLKKHANYEEEPIDLKHGDLNSKNIQTMRRSQLI